MSHISENIYTRHLTEESREVAKQRLEEELSFGRVKMMVMNTKEITGVYFVSKDWVVSELIKALQIESVHKIACLYTPAFGEGYSFHHTLTDTSTRLEENFNESTGSFMISVISHLDTRAHHCCQ
jgi:glycine cleavage system H lipoate-binding protein